MAIAELARMCIDRNRLRGSSSRYNISYYGSESGLRFSKGHPRMWRLAASTIGHDTMTRLKERYWQLCHEAKLFVLWFICEFPLGPGAWLRAHFLPLFLERLGDKTIVQHGFRIVTPENVSIGANCNFAQGVFITGGGGVRIGDWVGVGPDVKIWSVNHRFDDVTCPWLLQGFNKKEVIIEDDVWLAANVFVMPGVTIGRGAIVSACSVVSKSIPPYALFAGNPGRVVGWRKAPGDTEGPAASETSISEVTTIHNS